MFNTEEFETIIKDTNFLCDWIDISSESFENEGELREYLEERITECEIIYYHKACKFLSENDCSLSESLQIAHGYGYTTDKLNSEILATLLLQSKLNKELNELDLSDCFTN